jgi:hypothetical protein
MLEPSEGFRVQDAVAVALVSGADGARLLGPLAHGVNAERR